MEKREEFLIKILTRDSRNSVDSLERHTVQEGRYLLGVEKGSSPEIMVEMFISI